MSEAWSDYQVVLDEPHPVILGSLPPTWRDVPADVVINLCGIYPTGDPGGRLVLGFPLLDALDRSIAPDRAGLEGFLATCHARAMAGPSYWHCHAGLNRSGLALAAYLHLYRGMRISDAIARLRAVRSEMVLCNHLFEALLRGWYGGPDEQEFQRVTLQAYLSQLHPDLETT